MNEYEKRYDYQIWKKEFGANMSGVLPPEQAQVAYNLTYFCSSIQLQIQQKPFWDLEFEDFELINYKHHPIIKFPVAV